MESLYYISHWLFKRGVPVLPRLLMLIIRLLYQSFVPYQCVIGKGVSFGHKQGIVIAPGVTVGARCKIRHQVTLGGGKGGVPTIGDDVEVGAGAKVIGKILIGNRVKIGANAVVVDDVPDDSTVVGVPARVLDKLR